MAAGKPPTPSFDARWSRPPPGRFPTRNKQRGIIWTQQRRTDCPSAHRTRARLIFRTVHVSHPAPHFPGKKRNWLAQEPPQFPFSTPRHAAPGRRSEKIPAGRKNPEGIPRRTPGPISSEPPVSLRGIRRFCQPARRPPQPRTAAPPPGRAGTVPRSPVPENPGWSTSADLR